MAIWTPVLENGKPIYLAIADAIGRDVNAGTLVDGSRLPPQRDLAWRLGVTLGTVTRAYKEAEARGLLDGHVGRGSYVRNNFRIGSIPSHQDASEPIDLSHAMPPPVIAPADLDAALQHLSNEPNRLELLEYTPPGGFSHHQEFGASWLKMLGIEVEPSEVTITAGAHLALITVIGAIAEPREAVMAEEVNYALIGSTLRNAYLLPLPIAMDEDGLVPTAFEMAAKSGQSRILYLVPTLQNPMTHTMSRGRREAIVSIARRYNITIIEDDIFRLLDARTQPSTFYNLAPERTFYITGLSKTLSPGLRIGFIASPRGQEKVLNAHIRTAASRSVGITAEIARYWFDSGLSKTILTRIRNEFDARRALFAETFKTATYRCNVGAPFAWLELPSQWSAGRFSASLAERGVRVSPASAFNLSATGRNQHVRVCFGQPQSTAVLRTGLEAIRSLMQESGDEAYLPVA